MLALAVILECLGALPAECATHALSAEAVSAPITVPATSLVPVFAGDDVGFTPAQIGGEYVVTHQQVLVSASQNLQAQREAIPTALLAHKDALLTGAYTPSLVPKDAKVSVVDFFDYQCIYCAKMALVVKDAIEANPGVCFAFKEFVGDSAEALSCNVSKLNAQVAANLQLVQPLGLTGTPAFVVILQQGAQASGGAHGFSL